MSLQNFHVDAGKSDPEILKRAVELYKDLVSSLRHLTANGGFNFGFVKLADGDLNRIHSIVNEIDSRRLFYRCGEDEIPRYALQSAYEARDEIRKLVRGVWATEKYEVLVQEIGHVLADYCTKAERLMSDVISDRSDYGRKFWDLTLDMRLNIWLLVAIIKANLGDVIRPRNLPPEILEQVESARKAKS